MIRLSDIEKIEDRRREVRKDIYIKLYEQFSRKIRQTVEFGQKQVFLTVPGYLIGFPTFNRLQAADYLKRQLERGQFDVTRIDDFIFHVSWAPVKHVEPEPTDEDFPTMINLKKAANKNKKYFPG